MRLVTVEQGIVAEHPIWAITRMVDELLAGMSTHCDEINAAAGAPLVPLETLRKEGQQALRAGTTDL